MTLCTIYLDVMVDGRFYRQLPYHYHSHSVIDFRNVKKYILSELPTLTRKNWKVGFSKDRVIK